MENYSKQIRARIFFLLFGLAGSACPLFGQASPAKILSEKDYALWGRLVQGQMNAEGTWTSWRMRYDDGRDTLYVGKTSGAGGHRSFTNAGKESFFGRSHFAYLTSQQTLRVLDLDNGREWEKTAVASYEAFGARGLLLAQSPQENGLSHIAITDWAGREKLAIRSVRFWKACPAGRRIALVAETDGFSYCAVLDLGRLTMDTVARTAGKFEFPAWDRNGRFLALASKGHTGGGDGLYCHDTRTQKTLTLDTDSIKLFSGVRRISTGARTLLSVSENGKNVFFNTFLPQRPTSEGRPLVEIWNASDRLIYPSQRALDAAPQTLLARWETAAGRASLVSDTATPVAALTGKMDFAVAFDPLAYEPQLERDGPADLYLADLRTGQKKKWLERQHLHGVFPLPASNKILYKEGTWKIFDPQNGSVLDCGVPTDSIASERLSQNLMPASDAAGRFLLLPDGADLWKISTASGRKTRLTRGREKGIAYLLPEKSALPTDNYGLRFLPSFDLSKPLALRMKNREGSLTGYSLLLPDGKLQKIAYDALGHSGIISDAEGRCLGFITESFERPRALKIYRNGACTEIFASNPHQKEYRWGTAELVKYQVGGQEMQGVLYCPHGTDSSEKHPLVAHIYEIQSDGLYKAAHPSFTNAAGFNVANLVGKGYFVLLPDIRHGMGNPGKDASASLDAALDSVIARYPVDPSRLALVGHSFGGYETAAVIGYTNRFRAAVMGAGMSDAVSFYLTANKNNRKANYWRYETGQSRIGKSLFEDRQAYLDNSPVLAADKIETPLLIWTGANDIQVPPEQSYAMHLALRRLGKRSALLVYPDEGHSFLRPDSNRDLTLRLEQWLDYFLKGVPADWIK